jgi:GTPase SAR1 family protein
LAIAEGENLQNGLIIVDDITTDPILDFVLYRDAISRIIKNSYPKFTIGIFGDWGTGKTTLMNSIVQFLKDDKNIVVVRFESWRYEREDQFALIPLLKTIAFAFPGNEERYQDIKQRLKSGATSLLKKTPDIISSVLAKYLGDQAGKITKEMIEDFRKEVNAKVELLVEVDRDTLYFDGFEDIRKEIIKIRKENLSFRIVVFIDDLDRCSPKKTLEVLESIKIFLGMEGFIYVLGLSHDIISKLIDLEYKESGVKGEQYIKKIIQIPITLPKWNNEDIIDLVLNLVEKGIINEDYQEKIKENIDLISVAIEHNPREIKRFLNNFIVAYEIFRTIPNFNDKELLIIQAIQLRWNNFYHLLISSDKHFREELSKYSKMNDEDRIAILDIETEKDEDFENKVKEEHDQRIRKILSNFKTDSELWSFLTKNMDILDNIKDWKIYRRVAEISTSPNIEPKSIEEALGLLKIGNIEQFNNKRSKEFLSLNLEGFDLSKLEIAYADLKRINLKNTNLSYSNLSNANLTGANLSNADLTSALLIDVKDFINMKMKHYTILNDTLANSLDIIQFINKYKTIKVIELSDRQELIEQLKKRYYYSEVLDQVLKSKALWLLYSHG